MVVVVVLGEVVVVLVVVGLLLVVVVGISSICRNCMNNVCRKFVRHTSTQRPLTFIFYVLYSILLLNIKNNCYLFISGKK